LNTGATLPSILLEAAQPGAERLKIAIVSVAMRVEAGQFRVDRPYAALINSLYQFEVAVVLLPSS